MLAYGMGRSYGDACLNENGILLDARGLNRFIRFDRETGLLECEAGVSLDDILTLAAPAGWFLPVTPGTRWITVGGAIANDVHGKNHHRAGTFGCHVRGFELWRSSGERRHCTATENADLFRATIGGLGLTGLILSATIQLRRVDSPHITMERIRFEKLDDFFPLSRESDASFEYTVAWVDCLAKGRSLGRGAFMRGNHATRAEAAHIGGLGRTFTVPMEAPGVLLNPLFMHAFNAVYYRWPPSRVARAVTHWAPFFYPLDAVHHWNLMYGRRGFIQFQCVVPDEAIREILGRIATSRQASFLAVLKTFGTIRSPGLMSFPRPGATLALDMAYRGAITHQLYDELDRVVADAGGAVYPAKDALMSPESFRRFFPQAQELRPFIDPRFSSSFWRRVTA